MRTCSRSRPSRSAAARASATGADREPGARTASVTPPRISSSTSTRAKAVEGFTRPHRVQPRPPARRRCPGRRPPRPAGRAPGRTHRQRAVDRQQRRAGDVVGEQRDGGQPAGERQLGQRRGQRDPGGDADRALQRRGDDARQAVRLGHPQRRPHAAQRLHLEDDDVARLAQVDPQRVGRAPDHLVGGDPDVDPAAQRGQLLERRRTAARRTPGPTRSSSRDAGDRGVDVPGGVGVDADRAGRAQGVAHRLDPREVVGRRSAPARRPSPWPCGSPTPRRSRAPARRRPPARSR